MALPNLVNHADTTDMTALKKWREIRSNSRDGLLSRNQHEAIDVDVSTGGTIVLTVNQREPVQLIRLTGSPGGGYTVEFADGNKQIIIENASGQTATIETATGATTPPTVLDGDTALLQIRGTDITVTAVVSLVDGSLLHSGQVNPTGDQNWADFELRRPELFDTSYVATSPTISSGTLTLNMENGNWFDVTLTEDVTDIVITNEPNQSGGIRLEDDSGAILLEDGSGLLIKEDNDAVPNIFLITRQDGTGGWTINFPVSFLWHQADGIDSPDLSLGVNELDVWWFFKLNSNVVNSLKLETGIDDHLGLEDGSGRLLLEDSGSVVWIANQTGINMG